MSARWLFWHRRDLRLADNLGLAAAAAAGPAVTGVFVLDPAILGAAEMAPARVWFLLESLQELQMRVSAAATKAQRSQRMPTMARKATPNLPGGSKKPRRGRKNLRGGAKTCRATAKSRGEAAKT